MTDSINRISDLSSATSGGTRSAKDKRSAKRFRHETEHDTVTISAEARQRFSANDAEWEIGEEK